MPKEERKDFNQMLADPKDMPKIQVVVDPAVIRKYGGSRMYFAPPLDYDRIMKQIPWGKVTTVKIFGRILHKKRRRTLPNRLPPVCLFPLRLGLVINDKPALRLIGGH